MCMGMGMEFGLVTFNLGAMTLTLGFLWMLLCPRYDANLPGCAWGLTMRDRCAYAWSLGPVICDLGAMTLTLRFSWMLLCPSCQCQHGQFVPVDNP